MKTDTLQSGEMFLTRKIGSKVITYGSSKLPFEKSKKRLTLALSVFKKVEALALHFLKRCMFVTIGCTYCGKLYASREVLKSVIMLNTQLFIVRRFEYQDNP